MKIRRQAFVLLSFYNSREYRSVVGVFASKVDAEAMRKLLIEHSDVQNYEIVETDYQEYE